MMKQKAILFILPLILGMAFIADVQHAEASGSTEIDISGEDYVMPPSGECLADHSESAETYCCDAPNDFRGYDNITDCVEKTGRTCSRTSQDHPFEVDACIVPDGTSAPPPTPNPEGGCPPGFSEVHVPGWGWMCMPAIDDGSGNGGDGDGDGDNS